MESNPYTICSLENEEQSLKVEKYVQEKQKLKEKTSFCRFFLRGICIFKAQYCKFAHSFSELKVPEFQQFYTKIKLDKNDREIRRREFNDKKNFNQVTLFNLKQTPYYGLYQYQFSQSYKASKKQIHSFEEICEQPKFRIKIRQVLHRQQWDGFIQYLQNRFPIIDFTVSFLSKNYGWVGFDKPNTRCKYTNFLKYMANVKKYVQVDIVMPPYVDKHQTYFVNNNRKQTYLQQNIEQIYGISAQEREEKVKQKMQEIETQDLSKEINKKFICRYYMAGHCHQKQCQYAHSIKQLNYDIEQIFEKKYRQIVLPLEKRLNYISLYEYGKNIQQFKEYSLDDINFSSEIRSQIRKHSHMQLFKDFLLLLEQILKTSKFSIQDLEKYYKNVGFNHTNENKFPHLVSALWPLRYCTQDVTVKENNEKRKTSIVYKIPADEILDKKYYDRIRASIEEEVEKVGEGDQILESVVRRNVYSHREDEFIPLHSYLRLRNKTFQAVLEDMFPEYGHRIFFETSEENLKKLGEIVRKYVKKKKQYLHRVDEIEDFVKLENKEFLNVNHFINMRAVIQQLLIEAGKRVYFWPFENNAYVVDKSHFQQHEKSVKIYEDCADILKCDEGLKVEDLATERIVVVDSFEDYLRAEKVLRKCRVFGVDLEGKLTEKGYIDLVQVSTLFQIEGKRYKQIFVFDIFVMKQGEAHQKELECCTGLLKAIFEDPKKVKILHDCRQDSTALYHLMGIKLSNVFDTSGMDVYYHQKNVYEGEKEKGAKGVHILKRIYDVRVPGLNTILDYWKAPNGINVFKDSMKKKFGGGNRQYFEERPIDPQFLQYSARDVQDLVEVFMEMKALDSEAMRYFVGSLYSDINIP